MSQRSQSTGNMIVKRLWSKPDPCLINRLQQQLSLQISFWDRLSSIDLEWRDSFAARCLFPSVSNPYLHLPHYPTIVLLSQRSNLCTDPHQADKTQKVILPTSIDLELLPSSLAPLPHKRPSGCCEGNLNHLSTNAIGHCDFGSE